MDANNNYNNQVIPTHKIDFSHIDIKERHVVWKESISTVFESVLSPEYRARPFNATLTSRHFSSLVLTHASSGPQYFNRPLKLIARDGLDHCVIQLYLQGSTSGQWGRNNNSTVRAGDIFLLDLTQPIESFASDFSNLTMCVPRRLLAEKLPEPERYHGRVLPRESALAKLLGEHLKYLNCWSQTLSNDELSSIAEGVVSLTGSYFSQGMPDESCNNVQIATRESIRQYIIKNLSNPNLGPDVIAAHFRISRAYLYRLFDSSNGISHFILEQRLLKAFNQLNSPIGNTRRISQVAYEFGFSSESHFCRSFRRAFGMTPSEVRQQACSRLDQPESNTEADQCLNEWVLSLS